MVGLMSREGPMRRPRCPGVGCRSGISPCRALTCGMPCASAVSVRADPGPSSNGRSGSQKTDCSKSLFKRDHLLLPSGSPACTDCYDACTKAEVCNRLPSSECAVDLPIQRRYKLPKETRKGIPDTNIERQSMSNGSSHMSAPPPIVLKDVRSIETAPISDRPRHVKPINVKSAAAPKPLDRISVSKAETKLASSSSSPLHQRLSVKAAVRSLNALVNESVDPPLPASRRQDENLARPFEAEKQAVGSLTVMINSHGNMPLPVSAELNAKVLPLPPFKTSESRHLYQKGNCRTRDSYCTLSPGSSSAPGDTSREPVVLVPDSDLRKAEVSSSSSLGRYSDIADPSSDLKPLRPTVSQQRIWGGMQSCPGCDKRVAMMENGTIAGPHGSRWHQKCLRCGSGAKHGSQTGVKGCQKILDASAIVDTQGRAWCRFCSVCE